MSSYGICDITVVIPTYNTAPVDLPNELAIIDWHRLRIRNAYMLFGNYATELRRDYRSLLTTKIANEY